ncbi:MAG: FHA domain-containing protein [Myxococcota bacterium]|nr:FHA domain-containing protein [Myxococcota bacterium]
MFTVKVSQKSGPEEVLNFSEGEINIGRVRGNEIVLPKSNISKRHAMFTHSGGALAITDTKSTNGTFVNGDRISGVCDLSVGDKVFLGDFTIEVIDLGSSPAKPASTTETKNHKSQPDIEAPKPGNAALLEQVLDDDDWGGQSGFEGDWNDDWSIAKASQDDISIDPLEAATALPKAESSQGSDAPGPFGDETGEMTGGAAPNVIIPPAPYGAPDADDSPITADARPSDAYHDGASTASIVEAPPMPTDDSIVPVPQPTSPGLAGLHTRVAMELDLEFCRPEDLRGPRFRNQLEATLRSHAEAMLAEGLLSEQLGVEAAIERLVGEYTARGPLLISLANPAVTEIHINSSEQIYLVEGGVEKSLDAAFISQDSMLFVFAQMLGISVVEFLDAGGTQLAHTEDGLLISVHRFDSTPALVRGVIRRLPGPCHTRDLIDRGVMSPEIGAFFQLCSESRQNILLSLAPSADGAELFQHFASLLPEAERLVCIQDISSVDVSGRNGVHLSPSAEPSSLEQLLRRAALENPSRIFLDTALGQSAVTVTELMATRYRGSVIATHTSSPDEASQHLVRLSNQAGIGSPAAWIAAVVDIVVQVRSGPAGSIVVESVSEVERVEGDKINLVPIFVYDGNFSSTGAVPKFCESDQARDRASELSLFIARD